MCEKKLADLSRPIRFGTLITSSINGEVELVTAQTKDLFDIYTNLCGEI